ncbi:transcriptional regulator with XRE-family HTH domain [Pedobacter sp. AK017]|uniref:helix-turn-helix domain-containing protein n=1 Tax=Pedobacter sp. AK017 TaxID=2723073 RepID=UPI00160FDE1A|nr:helix-turn-helix transcriptional regulator [Pedobacter sp. AK017]MBB5437343.1 transcriptional regulator with XRE-family HTH domain [Pedobacter sp. AK017]
MYDTSIGKKLRVLRKNRHWLQRDVAERLNISVPAYSKIECAQTEVTISRLKQLAVILEVKVCWLMDGEEDAVLHQENEVLKEQLRASHTEIMVLQKKLLACVEKMVK